MSEIPDWAIERALTRFPRPKFVDGSPWSISQIREDKILYQKAVHLLAEQIYKHEEPPVDPLEEIFNNPFAEGYDDRSGAMDAAVLRAELAKRGLQIVPLVEQSK